MKSGKGRFGFLMGVVAAAAGMAIFVSSAFAGFVVEVQIEGMAPMDPSGSKAKSMAAVLKLQDKKSRLDADKVSLISLGDDNTMMLMHEMKMKMVMPTPKATPVAEGAKEKVLDKPKATGKKDKISGYDVEEYVLEKPTQKITIWMTQDANALKLREGMESVFAKQARGKEEFDYKTMPGCPIQVIMDTPARTETRRDGKTVEKVASKATMTVTSIKEENLADTVFQAPADYQDMSKMMEQQGGPGGAGAPGSAKPRSVAPARP